MAVFWAYFWPCSGINSGNHMGCWALNPGCATVSKTSSLSTRLSLQPGACQCRFVLSSWQCLQLVWCSGILPGSLRGTNRMLVIEAGLALCKANTLPAILSLWPLCTYSSPSINFFLGGGDYPWRCSGITYGSEVTPDGSWGSQFRCRGLYLGQLPSRQAPYPILYL